MKHALLKFWNALAIITVVNGLGSNLNTVFSSVNTSLK